MAVAMNLGDFKSPFGFMHPRDKQDVGSRVVPGALNVTYGQHVNPQVSYPVSAMRTGDGQMVVTYPNNQLLNVTENGSFQVGGVTAFRCFLRVVRCLQLKRSRVSKLQSCFASIELVERAVGLKP